MKEEKSPSGPNGSVATMSAKSSFAKLFAVGVIGWLLGGLVLFGLSWIIARPEGFSSAAIWTISHGWIGFLIGLVLLVGYGIVKGGPVGVAAFSFVLPAALLSVLCGICLLIYPDNLLREELLTYLPVVLLFYVLGLLWLWMRKDSAAVPAMARAVIPAVVGGFVILGFVAVPVFASDAFRYRDAFQLVVSKTAVKDGTIHVDATIEIRKPGNYRFSAPRYVWEEITESTASEPQVEMGQFTWGSAGEPKLSAVGVYPLEIVWKRGVPRQPGVTDLPPYEDMVCIEVRSPELGEKVIYSMCAPMQWK